MYYNNLWLCSETTGYKRASNLLTNLLFFQKNLYGKEIVVFLFH